MLSFREYCLMEAKPSPIGGLKFVNGQDDDFFYDNFKIITFNKGDINNYKLEGRTNGIMSHACKHLSEVNKEFVDNVISQVKNTMIEYVKEDNHPEKYEFRYFSSKGSSSTESPLKLINSAPREAVINFLDLVNDKYILGDTLAPIENKMVKYLKTLAVEYARIIKSYMDVADEVEKTDTVVDILEMFKTSDVVAFYVSEQNMRGSDLKIFLHMKKHAIIMKGYSGVHTMFRIDNSGATRVALIQTVLKRFARKWRFYNANVGRAMDDFVG